ETRNIGMKKSKGEYITFIDSDDYVLKDYLYTLAELIHKYKADMSIVGVRSFDDNHLLRVRRRTRECCIYGKLATERMLYQKSIDVSANAMLLKRDKALRHLFPSNRFFEDAFVTYKYYYESSRVAYSTKVCYAYYQRPESIMHSKNQEFYDELDASDSIMLFFKNKEIELFDAAVSKAFSNYCQVLLRNPNIKKDFPDAYKRIDRFLRYSRWRIILNRRTRIKNKVAAILTIPGVSFFLSISKKIYIRISG
ncbi:MAG: glycosyltransferase, partial [Eubacterium sp.]|nr:glycosyltransferase [Eubacterium sp.]